MTDLRLAWRSLRRRPAFLAATSLALGLGVGAAVALFTLAEAVLWRGLPYPEPQRVVRVHQRWSGTERGRLSPAEAHDYAAQASAAFERFGVWAFDAANLGGAMPRRVRFAAVTPDGLAVFAPSLLAGRTLRAADATAAPPAVALVSHGLALRLHADAARAIGQRLRLDGASVEIVGVLPADFRLPGDFAADQGAEVVLPLTVPAATARGSHFLYAAGRLRAGVSPAEAGSQVAAVAARFAAAFPGDYPKALGFAAFVQPVADDVVGPSRPLVSALASAVGLVLLVALANVWGLFLLRREEREGDRAVRQALGASRGRLARERLAEAVVVGLLAGSLAWALSAMALAALPEAARLSLPRAAAATPSFASAALAFGLALALAAVSAALAAGAGGTELASLLHAGRRSEGGRAATRLRRGLVVAEAAVALALVAGGATLARSLWALQGVDPGFEPRGVVTTRVALSETRYATDEARRTFFRALRERLATLPGVIAVGGVTNLPLQGRLGDINVRVEGRPTGVWGRRSIRDGAPMGPATGSPRGRNPTAADAPRIALDWQVVTPGYFEAVGMRLTRGRGLAATDTASAPGAVVINEAAAALLFPGEPVLERRFTLGGGAGPGTVSVVGVVANLRHAALGLPPQPEMYLAHEQFTFWNGGRAAASLALALRATTDPVLLADPVRRAVAQLDPDLATAAFLPFEAIVSASLGRERLLLGLVGAFAAAALSLAATGLYALVAQGVTRRTRELGIRLAVGARPRDLLLLVASEGVTLAAAGALRGLPLAVATGHALRAWLFGVAAVDPASLAAAAALLVGAALLACLGPARRAGAVDPVAALAAD